MRKNNLQHISSCQPTYWPSDMTKQPELLDFCITKGIATQKISVESCLELTSDHTPIIVNSYTLLLQQPIKPSRYNKNTDCEVFRELIETQINLKIPQIMCIEINVNWCGKIGWHSGISLHKPVTCLNCFVFLRNSHKYSLHVSFSISGRKTVKCLRTSHSLETANVGRIIYRGADNSLARLGRKQATGTEVFEFHISYL
jgi:hypothetical protein